MAFIFKNSFNFSNLNLTSNREYPVFRSPVEGFSSRYPKAAPQQTH